MELINFILTDRVPAGTICDAHDQLQATVELLGLLDFEEQPESDEWQLACQIGEIEICVDEDDLVQAARLLPKAVQLANELIIQARRRA